MFTRQPHVGLPWPRPTTNGHTSKDVYVTVCTPNGGNFQVARVLPGGSKAGSPAPAGGDAYPDSPSVMVRATPAPSAAILMAKPTGTQLQQDATHGCPGMKRPYYEARRRCRARQLRLNNCCCCAGVWRLAAAGDAPVPAEPQRAGGQQLAAHRRRRERLVADAHAGGCVSCSQSPVPARHLKPQHTTWCSTCAHPDQKTMRDTVARRKRQRAPEQRTKCLQTAF